MLKINAKKNNNNNAHKQQKEILLEVKTYLSKFHPQQELIVSRYNNCLTIAPDLQKTLLTPEPILETIEEILEEPSEMTATDEYGNEIVFKEEADYSVIDEIISETEEVYEYIEKNEIDNEEVSEFKTNVKMENQVDEPWLIDEMKNSKLTLNTKFGKQVIYKCFQCSKVMQSSEEMKMHLIDHMDNKIHVDETVNDDYGEEIVEETVVPMLPKIYKSTQPKINAVLKPSNNTWMNDEIKKNRGIVKTENGPKYIYKCLECDYNCSGENTFRKHLQKFHQTSVHDLKAHYHSASDVNCCLDCGLKFKNAAAYKTHANCHFLFETISSQSSLLTCQDCRVVFFKDVHLSTHYRRHGADNMYDKIPSIGVLYKQGKLHNKPIHAEIDVPDDEAFNCGYCTRKFATADSCFAHQMVVHATSYICPLCQRDFDGPRSAKHYTQHLQNKHSEVFPSIMFSCTYCAEAFSTIFDKLSHMKICNERKFISDSDGKKFFTKADLIKHVKFISGECVFKCPSCHKKCRSPSDLQIHVRSHTLERPYPCSQCSKAFRTLSARSSHMETHTGFEIEVSLNELFI